MALNGHVKMVGVGHLGTVVVMVALFGIERPTRHFQYTNVLDFRLAT